MLAVGLAAYSLESVTFYYALETFTFRGTYNIDIHPLVEDVSHGKLIAEFEFLSEIRLNSTSLLFGVVPAFSKCPLSALLVRFSFFSP